MKDDLALPILLFDDECLFCMRFKQALEHFDKNHEINYISVHNQNVYEKYPFLKQEECLETVHLIDLDQKTYKGVEIVDFLKEKIPAINKIKWLLEKEATKKALKVFYDKVNELKKTSINPCPGCKK